MIETIGKTFTKIFGSHNERMIKSYTRRVEQINAAEDKVRALVDGELRSKTQQFREQLRDGQHIEQILPQALAVAREVMDRAVGIRNIFNPEHQFDPAKLPADVQPAYARLAEQMAGTEPIEVPGGAEPIPGWLQLDVPVAIYDAVRQLYPESKPPFRARPFDVQLIGGMVLGEGTIAEMKTGEGKTIVAPLACYLAYLEGLQCYVVTVNDYLVQRDRDWVFPFFHHMDLTVGAIHPFHMQPPPQKMGAYGCNVVYGTNSEFGFDYLRDNMCLSDTEQVQKHRDFCIIDEVDSILVDEARTPLIISGAAHDDAPRYGLADIVARHLIQKQRDWDRIDEKVKQCEIHVKGLEGDIRNSRDKDKITSMREEVARLQENLPQLEAERDQHTQYYEVEMEKKASHLTHEGVAEAQKQADIGSFYVGNNMEFPHLLENALRAYAVYQRDKDYVVQNGEVVIVDEFTGRLMIGRQWSDGLHQAVEAKERVKIKEETQTMATVTIQNYFKLFKRLAGMTGTAVTEATELNEIYNLDVACIPTNVPVIRADRTDVIYISKKDKWSAVLDEIKHMHDVGRPVLVGTTSVETSEDLSQRLTKRLGIKHEVLNAKQHEREANIVADAGGLGAVMIATNMAGRGTDIRLQPISRVETVRHWQLRNILPRDAKPEMEDEQIIALVYRHLATQSLDIKPAELDAMSDDQVCLKMLRHWSVSEAFIDADKADSMSAEQCKQALDKLAGFMLHRLSMFEHVEKMGGLHIVGTERHESRRIDNQLRGRAGRQGDRGSSRFFVALEDDLMKLFAGPKVLAILSKLGMKEGDALESRLVTKRLEGAQRKVEERNYEIRKNLLEYDEVMEHQRNAFYGTRQAVLEGREIDTIIFSYIADAIDDACDVYIDHDYVASQAAEWCRQTLDVSIEASKLRLDNLADLQTQVRAEGKDESRQVIEITLGEYMSNDLPPEQWDLRSLSSWAMSRFSVDLKQNQLRQMSVDDVTEQLAQTAQDQIDKKDLVGLAKFLEPLYAQKDLAEWVKQKFNIKIEPDDLAPNESEKPDDTKQRVAQFIYEKASNEYRQREIRYPIEFAMDMVTQTAQQDQQFAAEQLVAWANQRYDLGWNVEHVSTLPAEQIYEQLVEASTQWHRNGRLDALVDQALTEHDHDPQKLAEWAKQRLGQDVQADDWQNLEHDALRQALIDKGRAMLRQELTQLERFVLLQILDTAWKDHLYAMDQLKDSVGLRGYAERDPRIEYKREGANQFHQMQKTVRDRVTELIFRARLTPNVEARNVYGDQRAEHAEADSVMNNAAGAAQSGTAEQREDQAAAREAGDAPDRHQSRKARRAAAAGRNRGDEQAATQQSKPGYKKRKKRRR